MSAVDSTRKRLAIALLVLAAVGVALVVSSATLFDHEEPRDPEIESVSIIESGCYDDVRARAMSSSDGTVIGTLNDTSPDTEIGAAIRRTSRSEATVATYRVDIYTDEPETHGVVSDETSEDGETCPGRIVYRVEYAAPYPDAADALRVERYIDNSFSTCSSSSSGPDTGCLLLYEDQPTHWSNGTVEKADQ
ncbi:hypothetical protein OB919_10705 [Halobacteria archaeon AArc-curdl1]|uniref:Uncharacterized protein n=1 Tax=Natronosalvus hydrolyticus TaxID=2979988 RepID=A0AAP2Z8D2_9EURY|nr:hypothetical protein [Halobacteria archaeon AArc-curdl1]